VRNGKALCSIDEGQESSNLGRVYNPDASWRKNLIRGWKNRKSALIRKCLTNERFACIEGELPGKARDPGQSAIDNRLFVDGELRRSQGNRAARLDHPGPWKSLSKYWPTSPVAPVKRRCLDIQSILSKPNLAWSEQFQLWAGGSRPTQLLHHARDWWGSRSLIVLRKGRYSTMRMRRAPSRL
jgi:hypothetical protein